MFRFVWGVSDFQQIWISGELIIHEAFGVRKAHLVRSFSHARLFTSKRRFKFFARFVSTEIRIFQSSMTFKIENSTFFWNVECKAFLADLHGFKLPAKRGRKTLILKQLP